MKIPNSYIKKIPRFFTPALSTIPQTVIDIVREIDGQGGKAFLVGGSVRDMLLGKKPTKDLDIEVYGMQPDTIQEIVEKYGKVMEVGKSFGVLKYYDGTLEIDFSLPRKDSKVGEGHRGFAVDTDPFMDIKEAVRRRDFTINAMMYDPVTEVLIDPFHGLADLEKRVLRVVDEKTFGEDPLRVMRGVQFIARFDLVVELKSFSLMKKMVPCLSELPKERIQMEWKKLLLKSMKPSLGLKTMLDLGIIERYHSELFELNRTEQDSLWHPEGNAWIHTLLCLNAGAQIIHRERMRVREAFVIMLSILCHDFGKPSTTIKADDRISTPEHESEGEVPTREFLNRIGVDNDTKEKVIPLVKNHLAPFSFYKAEFQKKEKITDGAIRRLARRLYPATIYELTLVSEADYLGKGTRLRDHDTNFKSGQWLIERSQQLNVDRDKPENVIEGKDLIALGFSPDPIFGSIIKVANQLRDDKEYARQDILEYIRMQISSEDALRRLQQLLKEK
ncbi:MAG: CCA tRNA nucleotidyltransferase [Candidatus Cloacimonetes bacterium]|nr:CCA tRNA nucleotidyltransferase [Candidatus Cloacimonadota bacterium]